MSLQDLTYENAASERGPNTPLLTICIPTYNRAHHLEKLLWLIEAQLLPEHHGKIEVVVVNNASKDSTRDVLSRFSNPGMDIIHRTEFLLTAEENIIHSLQYCHGDYVWFLGDDDVPIVHNFADHIARLESDQSDFFIFNAALADKDGTVFSSQVLKMNTLSVSGTLIDIVLSSGCLFVFAGISNLIIRRSILSFERGCYYLSVSRIYSMVAWMIEAGASSRATLVNQPIVYYRENDYSTGHWERVAAKMDVGDQFFWSVGLIQLLSQLVEQQCLSWGQLGQIFDVTRDGIRYRLVDDVMHKIYQQINLGKLENAQNRQRMSQLEFEQCRVFCIKSDPMSFDMLAALADLYHAKPESGIRDATKKSPLGSDPSVRFLRLFDARQRAGQWLCRVEQIFLGYEILWTPLQYVAVQAQNVALRESVMQQVDPIDQPPLVFASATKAKLLERLKVESKKLAESPNAGFSVSTQHDTAHASLVKQLAASNELIAAIYNSDSWAFSYPFRALTRLTRQLTRTIGAMWRLIPALLRRPRI